MASVWVVTRSGGNVYEAVFSTREAAMRFAEGERVPGPWYVQEARVDDPLYEGSRFGYVTYWWDEGTGMPL